jgi:UDP-N-acetylglucosamine enolpyruvyl transferase
MKGLSRGFGFRRPARRGSVCIWPLKARMAVAPLVSAARQFRHVQKTLNCPAPRAMSRRMATRELVCPPLLARLNPTGIQWPGAARMGRRSPYNGHAPALREWGPLWNVSGLAGFSNARRSLAALDWGMPTPCVVAVPLAPVRSNGAHHVALAPFNPQNSPFGYKEYQDK